MLNVSCYFFLLLLVTNIIAIDNVLDYVNPFIGTGGFGYGAAGIPLGAQVPFGPIRVGADTCEYDQEWTAWTHQGGYYYYDTQIRMISHTHLVGDGDPDYGAIGIFPITIIPKEISKGKNILNRFPWIQKFYHDKNESEYATAGYYKVLLQESQIFVELTATKYVGIHRYHWLNPNGYKYILFDISYTLEFDACYNSSYTVNFTSNEITGFVHVSGSCSHRFGGVKTYFVAQFNQLFDKQSFIYWHQNKIHNVSGYNKDTFSMTGNGDLIGVILQFDEYMMTDIELYVAISWISVVEARNNLNNDLKPYYRNRNISIFDQVKNATQQQWIDMLNMVDVDDIDESYITKDNLTVFYSCIYHSFFAPTLWSESSGNYLGFDSKIHSIYNTTFENKGFYTDLSIWDVWRSEFPWLNLMVPDIMGDVAQSLVLMYEQGGDLPRWALANGYEGSMFGQHADIILADAVAHGLMDKFDIQQAYNGMFQGATKQQQHAGRTDIDNYIKYGYVAYDVTHNACCDTLAYSYDDWAIAQVAKYLNKTDDYQRFMNSSMNYKNLWNDKIQFFCPRQSYNSSELNCPLDPLSLTDDRYDQGNAWHYRWFVPYDPFGAINLWNSTDFYIEQLDKFFNLSFKDPSNWMPNPYYWAGNEEDLFSVYMFAYPPASRVDLTQYYMRKILQYKYLNDPLGIPGQDDYGTMSSWAIWGYLGFGPRTGDGTYIVGSPYFNNITLHKKDGNDIHLIVNNNGKDNVYVVNCTINGKTLETPFFGIDDIKKGAVIEFWMDSKPNHIFWKLY